MKKIILSYSAINNLHEASHTWINKVMGIETPTSEAMEKGKQAHLLLQKQIKDKTLELSMDFPVAEYHAQKPYNEIYNFHGYLDAANFASKGFLEIKTSGSHVWSQQDFDRSMQPRYYSWVTGFRRCLLLTCKFDLSNMKTYYREFTDEDWAMAKKWAEEGIAIIEKGDFTGGLDENGKCTGCVYAENCYFK